MHINLQPNICDKSTENTTKMWKKKEERTHFKVCLHSVFSTIFFYTVNANDTCIFFFYVSDYVTFFTLCCIDIFFCVGELKERKIRKFKSINHFLIFRTALQYIFISPTDFYFQKYKIMKAILFSRKLFSCWELKKMYKKTLRKVSIFFLWKCDYFYFSRF